MSDRTVVGVKPQLTKQEKREIIEAIRSGEPMTSIARRYERGRTTIYELKKKKNVTGSVARKVKLDKKAVRTIKKITHDEPTISTSKIRDKIGSDASISTVRRAVIIDKIDL